MQQSETRYRLLADNVMDVVVHWQADQVIWVSPSLEDMLGWSPEDWIGRQYGDFIHPSDLADFNQQTLSIREAGHVVDRYRMRAKDLKYHWVESHSKPYIDDHGTVNGIVATFRTIDSEVAAQQQAAHVARHDALTGLINRDEALARVGAITGPQRNPGQQTAILFCDIDKFKEVNDRYGHAAGDEVLRVIAKRVRGQVRVGDTAARVGGDELLVILNRVHDLDDAVHVAEKIRQAASEPVTVPDGVVATSLSIGATLVCAGEDADSLIARADAAMYEAKANGRNRVMAFDGQVK
jgi:diguanylate cyclase (GGDEF)-like protein/PAS domain S-box-containing protein